MARFEGRLLEEKKDWEELQDLGYEDLTDPAALEAFQAKGQAAADEERVANLRAGKGYEDLTKPGALEAFQKRNAVPVERPTSRMAATIKEMSPEDEKFWADTKKEAEDAPFRGTGGTSPNPYKESGGTSPAAPKAKALLAKLKAKTQSKGVSYAGLTDDDINRVGERDGMPDAPVLGDKALGPDEAPQEAVAASPGGFRGAVASATMGATPDAPRSHPDDLRDAQGEASRSSSRADMIDGLHHASSLISGTQANTHAGDGVRKRGSQGVADVLARDDRRLKEEDQGFQRDANSRANAGDQRSADAEGRSAKTFSDSQEMNAPGTRQAKAYEALFRAKRPREAAGITKQQSAGMSANDWKEALSTKDDPLQKPAGAGGGGMNGRNLAALTKGWPNETAAVWAATQRINQMVEKSGGWDKMEGVGLVAGKVPTMFLGDEGKAFRQEVGNLAATHLQSKGGKAITNSEERIILEKIKANPGNATPDELKRAMQIIERNTASYARSSLAALPAQQRSEFINNAGGNEPGELESWVNQSQTTPTGGARQSPDAAMQWLRAHPNDPRAAAIRKKLGAR